MSGSSPRPAELRAAAHEAARARRSPCIAEERLLAFHAGGLTAAEQDGIRDHLAVCAACGEASRDARRFLEAMGERPRAAAARRWRPPLAIAAAVTLATAAAWLASRPRPAGHSVTVAPTTAPQTADAWGDLAIVKPPYVPAGRTEDELVFRGADEARAREGDFARAMAAYARDDLAAAHRGLAAHLARHPEDRQAQFYRGATELLLGRTKEAIVTLSRAAQGEGPAALDGRFYLGLACLREGDLDAAARHLEAVERSPAARQRDEARVLLRRLRATDRR